MNPTLSLRAFHGDPKVQARYINRVDMHYAADEITQGAYVRKNGTTTYCAVGCVLHDPNGGHEKYETLLGIPQQLAFLEDRIFERLSIADAKEWARTFLAVIPLGADLSRVTHLFMAWLMDDPTYGVASVTKDEEIKALALEVARRYRTGEGLTGAEAEELATKLRDARAAWAAWDARDAWAARAAWDAWDARAAWAARDARDARDAWREKFVEASASELLRLLAEAPVPSDATKAAA